MKRVRYMTREDGRTLGEIQAELPDLFIWLMSKSKELTEEDREMLLHPNQWGPGYANLILSKYFKVAPVTIRDYLTAYNRSVKAGSTDHALTSH